MADSRDIHIACPQCHLMDYYVIHNEGTGQSRIECQNCKAEFLRIQWVPEVAPSPTVVI